MLESDCCLLRMDTPDNRKCGTPISKIEDSPVFNYINNLSPIKPVSSSTHVTQGFQFHNFSAIPSIFSSPHLNVNKDLKFLQRHVSSETAKQDAVTDNNGNQAESTSNTTDDGGELLPDVFLDNRNQEESTSRPAEDEGNIEETTSPFEVESLDDEEGKQEHDRRSEDECDWDALILDSPAVHVPAEENPPNPNGETSNQDENPPNPNGETSDRVSLSSETATTKTATTLQCSTSHGGRRRCLVFEAKKLVTGSSTVGKPSSDKQAVHRTLPGIGLHLNSIAGAAAANVKIIKQQPCVPTTSRMMSGISVLLPRTVTPPAPPPPPPPRFPDVKTDGTGSPPDAGTPNRKRHRSGGDDEGCKHCNCKKSKCLKLYCECFAAGMYCVDTCSCQDCYNKPVHECTVLATRKQIENRNPLAFAPKVVHNAPDSGGVEPSKTPASARHKRGCNCKKSGCLKKYCECFQAGVGCSFNCRCESCKNSFGRKDGHAGSDTSAAKLLPVTVESPEVRVVSSPNGKRVSPPQSSGTLLRSPARKGGRRLVLQSIPSFPPLTPQHR